MGGRGEREEPKHVSHPLLSFGFLMDLCSSRPTGEVPKQTSAFEYGENKLLGISDEILIYLKKDCTPV